MCEEVCRALGVVPAREAPAFGVLEIERRVAGEARGSVDKARDVTRGGRRQGCKWRDGLGEPLGVFRVVSGVVKEGAIER